MTQNSSRLKRVVELFDSLLAVWVIAVAALLISGVLLPSAVGPTRLPAALTAGAATLMGLALLGRCIVAGSLLVGSLAAFICFVAAAVALTHSWSGNWVYSIPPVLTGLTAVFVGMRYGP